MVNKNDYKKLSFWVGLISGLLIVFKVILNSFGLNFEVKTIIEVISFVLAILVMFGLLNGTTKGSLIEINEEIKKDITEKVFEKEENEADENKKEENKVAEEEIENIERLENIKNNKS